MLHEAIGCFEAARLEGRPFWLTVPGACRCGRDLALDLAATFAEARLEETQGAILAGAKGDSGLVLVFEDPAGGRRLEYRLLAGPSSSDELEGLHAPGMALVELEVRPGMLLELDHRHGAPSLPGTRAWSSWPMACTHGQPVPLIPLGQRSIPAFCARTRLEGELTLLSEPSWPGTEACATCPWFGGATGERIACAHPDVDRGAGGLCLEVDIYRGDGRKRRSFLELGADVPAAVRALMKYPGASAPKAVDIKFVVGDPKRLDREPDAFMERWRFYWNGEDWVRKPPGAPLHDWNKWGRELEFESAVEPGSLPPEAGWPPVLDLLEGTYLLRVLGVRWTVGRRGEPELEWSFRVLDTDQRGRKVFRRSPVRTSIMKDLVARDLALLTGQREAEIPRPGEPGFDAYLERLRGIAVVGKVARRETFTNLYLEFRPARR